MSTGTEGRRVILGRVMALPPSALREWKESLERSALAEGLWRLDEGARAPVPVATRPWFLPEACLPELHRATRRVQGILARLSCMRQHDPRLRELLPLPEDEEDWLRYADHPTRRPLFPRLDLRLGAEGFVFLEVNGVGPSGITWSAAAENAMSRHLVQLAPRLRSLRLSDARDLLADEIRTRAFVRHMPRVALLDELPSDETTRLAGHLGEYGFEAAVVHPAELETGREGGIRWQGRPVDAVFRLLGLGRLAALERTHGRLEGLRAAFARGLVLPGANGDLDSKATFEVMTSPEFEPWLRDEEVEVCRQHVAWTRLLTGRRTTGRRDEPIDLPTYALERREELVLKPNRSRGGDGVVLGPRVTRSRWEQAVEEALRVPGTFVLQSFHEAVQEDFPEIGPAGAPILQRRHLVAGVFATARGMALFGRSSPDPVVNLTRGGAVVPVLAES